MQKGLSTQHPGWLWLKTPTPMLLPYFPRLLFLGGWHKAMRSCSRSSW